ncbi:hypothetical protein AVEN_270448-1 [Araneus ventricosus]|uniref:Uncharacterized protein n=1 Tax=Araneus ventricosus TaxID=182803 RepID=A0A4Y1ZJK0_ARAVE|nr:hypothetical protein AVEN_270448-1 [Araneus ventricosus]
MWLGLEKRRKKIVCTRAVLKGIAFYDDEDILLGDSTQAFLEYDDDKCGGDSTQKFLEYDDYHFRDISQSAENPQQYKEGNPMDVDVCKAKQLKQTSIDSFLVDKNHYGRVVQRQSLRKEGNKDSSESSRVSDDLLAIPGPSGVHHVNTVSGIHVDSDSSKKNIVPEDMLAIPVPSGVQQVNTVSDSHDDSGIIIHKKRSSLCKKYQGEQIIFEATVNPSGFASSVWGLLLINLINTVRRLITEILQRSTVGLSPHDLIRICVFAPGLDYPISTCLHNVAAMTVETLLYEICKVLQSKKNLRLDEKLIFDVVTIKRPRGAGKKPVLNIGIDRLRKKSVISIPFDDEGICCARAIVVGHAAATNHPKYNSIRNGKWPLQKTLALQLHQNSGVPVSACGLDEIKKFEQFLNVQIHVISSENFNKLIYKGVEKTLKLYLWHHDNHYDLIKSMSGFLGKKLYCSHCDKGYEHYWEHRCENRCNECYSENCVGNTPEHVGIVSVRLNRKNVLIDT